MESLKVHKEHIKVHKGPKIQILNSVNLKHFAINKNKWKFYILINYQSFSFANSCRHINRKKYSIITLKICIHIYKIRFADKKKKKKTKTATISLTRSVPLKL